MPRRSRKTRHEPDAVPDRAVPEPAPGFTALGTVLRPHGLRGELRIHAFNPEAPHLQAGARIWIDGIAWRIAAARSDRGAWLLTIDGIERREDAEALRDSLIEAPDESIQRADDEFFVHELIGLRVVTDDGRDIGEIVDVMQPGANDVYVVMGDKGEVLVPATAEVVQRVDLSQGRMVITPLVGMLDETA